MTPSPEIFTNPEATCAVLAGLGHQVTAENLNYPSIGIGAVAGTETVIRTVTSVASGPVTYTASVNAPDGYEVSVDPATITVPPAERLRSP